MTPSPGASLIPLIAFALVPPPPLAAGESDGRASFAWRASYAEALSEARGGGRPILVYFPPVGGGPDPAPIGAAARWLGSPPRVEGVRVGADEVADLARRFAVRKVPCLLLLDARENVAARWEGSIPQDVWSSVRDVAERLRSRDSALRRRVREALERSEAGDAEGAYRAVAGLLQSPSAPPDVVEAAREVERRLVRRVRAEMLGVLAEEGLRSDAELRARLSKLRSATRHPGLKEEIRREERRLEETRIAGE